MKKHLKSIISLFAICAVIAMLLALTNYFTAPIIKDYEDKKANAALHEVLPDAKSFEKLSVNGLPEAVKEAYKADNGGYAFKLSSTGFGGEIVIMCGIGPNGKITKCKTLTQTESAGYGSVCGEEQFYSQFSGKGDSDYKDVIISGATVTTTAYQKAIQSAFDAMEKLKGGTGNE